MFEKYTQKARRTIFFARHEASEFGSPCIETEHLLLGMLQDDKALASQLLPANALPEIRAEIQARTPPREKIPTNVDLPLSNETTHVLSHAAQEADRLGHKHIGNEHLLLALLLERKCFAAILLNKQGLDIGSMRANIEGLSNKEGEE
jgi:ATP-dependent Clp protease ATP-binding subunit ClpC